VAVAQPVLALTLARHGAAGTVELNAELRRLFTAGP
jgi:hypothetical protein